MTPDQLRNFKIAARTAIEAKNGTAALTDKQKMSLLGWSALLLLLLAASFWTRSGAPVILAIWGAIRLFREHPMLFTMGSTYRRTLTDGELCRAAIIQANEILWRPGAEVGAPAFVLIAPGTKALDLPYLNDLVSRLMHDCKAAAKLQVKEVSAELKPLDYAITRNQMAIKYRRIPLPIAWTPGETAYAADLMIRRDFLKDGFLSGQSLWCLATPGPKGGLELIPYDVVPVDLVG